MGRGGGVAGCLVEVAGGVGVNLGSVVAVGTTWEDFVGTGVTGALGEAARVGATVVVAVLEGVGTLVQAPAASKTVTASPNARRFHCANIGESPECLRSVKSTAAYRYLRTNVARDTRRSSTNRKERSMRMCEAGQGGRSAGRTKQAGTVDAGLRLTREGQCRRG